MADSEILPVEESRNGEKHARNGGVEPRMARVEHAAKPQTPEISNVYKAAAYGDFERLRAFLEERPEDVRNKDEQVNALARPWRCKLPTDEAGTGPDRPADVARDRDTTRCNGQR
eukprot:scaffold360_cov374-Pavlova_lutheri.AAC.31